MTETVSESGALRQQIDTWRQAGQRIGLVPTMGALHSGHVALVRAALRQCDKVVVSIFVNPTQFGPSEDFDSYPRQLADDLATLKTAGAHLLYAPPVDSMYPDGFATSVSVRGVSEGLCGATRPGHFDGVSTVVTKLLLRCQPDYAFFGEKDYQQLQVIKRLVKDLDVNTHIVGVPTERAEDGLALSSRNAYLSDEARAQAPMLYATLQACADAIKQGAPVDEALARAKESLQGAGFAPIDYLELRDADDLTPLTAYNGHARLLVAARLGNTRLIDNIEVE